MVRTKIQLVIPVSAESTVQSVNDALDVLWKTAFKGRHLWMGHVHADECARCGKTRTLVGVRCRGTKGPRRKVKR